MGPGIATPNKTEGSTFHLKNKTIIALYKPSKGAKGWKLFIKSY
jgi:hypothetical protein